MRHRAPSGPRQSESCRRTHRSDRLRGSFSVVHLGLAACLTFASPAPTGGVASPAMVEATDPPCNATVVERTAWLMGTTLRTRVCAATRAGGIEAIDRAFVRVRRLEERLSTWRADSELSRLNNAPPGRWVPLSTETAALLAEVRGWVGATGGAFDPAAGAAIDAWDMRGAGRRPSVAELAAARRATDPGAWELETEPTDAGPRGPRARRTAGVRLDAGAFGKGAALRAAAAELRSDEVAWFLLDFGGQLTLWSRDPGDRWSIGVADPDRRDRTAVRLRVGPASIATTGASERAVRVDGERLGHVIDPRKATPVPAWGSVTVVTGDPLAADVLSTALFVLGPEAAVEWEPQSAAERPGVLVIEATTSGPVLHRNDRLDEFASVESMSRGIEAENPGVTSNGT